MTNDTLFASATDTHASADPRRWIALAVIASAQLMVVLDASFINIVLPRAQADLGIFRRPPSVGHHWTALARWPRRGHHRTQEGRFWSD